MRHAFWVDRGGTFTDCILHDRVTGALRATKILSSDEAPLVGIRQLLGLGPGESIPPSEIRLGTTVATNALLSRRGVSAALLVTRGFRDVLEIGDQTRPSLFELDIQRPAPLHRRVVEIAARCAPGGEVLARDEPEQLARLLRELASEGIVSLAVVVLHAYANGSLETEIRDRAAALGFEHVSLSHEVAPRVGFMARAATTVLDAYLTPLVRNYLAYLAAQLPGSSLQLMQSSGGLCERHAFRAQHALLSGPAGGAVACARLADQGGLGSVIGFDMGGTSTDVSRYAGELERVHERRIAGTDVMAPMLDVHTVAAGGGSICSFDGQRFRVGPESAGADPGPLCYGRPGASQLTVTDLNLVLGRLTPERFPFPLHVEPARERLEAIARELTQRGHLQTPEQIAQGFLRVANQNMADAIASVSVARGHAARGHTLIVFGGAGGQHACAVADLLGMDKLLFHPLSGVLSAYGIGLAQTERQVSTDAGRRPLGGETLLELSPRFAELAAQAADLFSREGHGPPARVRSSLLLGYAGTQTVLELGFDPALDGATSLRAEFEARHRRLFGYVRPEHPILVHQLMAQALSLPPQITAPVQAEIDTFPEIERMTWLWEMGQAAPTQAPVYRRSRLSPGQQIAGPALIADDNGSIVVDCGFSLRVGSGGLLHAERESAKAPLLAAHTPEASPDPVMLELMGNRFMSIARQMGQVLARTALSVNIRERLDFSCAIFDGKASLVANAPHIPVHLGAMSESVAAIQRLHPEPLPGDVFITNDPALGGSHLPDITVVTPVHDPAGKVAFYVASRGHHVDVGGKTPGSMPADSGTLAEEGVVFRGEKVVEAFRFATERVLEVLESGPYPARFPAQNIADLEAQIAANQRGVELLGQATNELGRERVERYMAHVQDYAAGRVAHLIRSLPPGPHRCRDRLDDGTRIEVSVAVAGEELHIDFSGTGAEHPGNLNAPRAVTLSAVLYVLRTLIAEPIPLNGGCLRHVRVSIPERSLLSAGPGVAVASGNVETSQRVVDVLLGALGALAASQGSMNNLTFGDEHFSHYETLAGGAGAGPQFAGASAVHTHMTNTRVTDTEILEARYPVRVLEFSVRRGSGGRGRFPGGDGLVRELEFLAPVEVSLVSERRATLPFGLCGGHSGAPGKNLHNGRELPGRFQFRAQAGDRLRIETPGGGGYGPPAPSALA